MDPLLDAFEYSPNLTHIALSNVGDPFQIYCLPWSQITVYDGADGPDDEDITETPHLHALTKMPLLESARLFVTSIPPYPCQVVFTFLDCRT